MRAVTWHGKRDVRVDDGSRSDDRGADRRDRPHHLDRRSAAPTSTSTRCSGRSSSQGDILGHEPMGVVEEVGADVTNIAPGDRVVIPFNISCGHCFMCDQGLHSQCETTQVRDQGMGAALFGYTKLYGEVPGGQAELPAGPAGAVRPDQGAGRTTRRPLPLSLRRAADRVAGRRVRGDPRRRQRRRARPGADRRHVVPDRAAPRRGSGDRRRPRAGAPRARVRARRRRRSTSASTTTSPSRFAR